MLRFNHIKSNDPQHTLGDKSIHYMVTFIRVQYKKIIIFQHCHDTSAGGQRISLQGGDNTVVISLLWRNGGGCSALL